jgi:hypothetical protein
LLRLREPDRPCCWWGELQKENNVLNSSIMHITKIKISATEVIFDIFCQCFSTFLWSRNSKLR